MRVGTLNLGLLHHFFSKVPHYYWRREKFSKALDEILKKECLDIVTLQEVWRSDDIEVLEQAISQEFLVLRSPARLSKRMGLVTLVRRNLSFDLVDHQVSLYRNILGLNIRAFHEAVAGYFRGVAVTILRDSGGREILIANTHLTPFEKNYRLRGQQLKALGSILTKSRRENSSVIVAGDINHSTAYLNSQHREKALAVIERFLKSSDLVDITQNLESFAPRRNSIAGGVYWGNAGEPLSLDRIWAGPQSLCRPLGEARLFADQPVGKNEDGRALHLSDHFGVMLEIELEGLVEEGSRDGKSISAHR